MKWVDYGGHMMKELSLHSLLCQGINVGLTYFLTFSGFTSMLHLRCPIKVIVPKRITNLSWFSLTPTVQHLSSRSYSRLSYSFWLFQTLLMTLNFTCWNHYIICWGKFQLQSLGQIAISANTNVQSRSETKSDHSILRKVSHANW